MPLWRSITLGGPREGRPPLSCFPFLQDLNIPPDHFVVDDPHKPVLLLTTGNTTKDPTFTFANPQFCYLLGFPTMIELFSCRLLRVVSKLDKYRFLQVAHEMCLRVGWSEISHWHAHLETRGGDYIKVAARHQVFTTPDQQLSYIVICIDQVPEKGPWPLPIEELRVTELAEWEEARLRFSQKIARSEPATSVPPSPTLLHDGAILAPAMTPGEDWINLLIDPEDVLLPSPI